MSDAPQDPAEVEARAFPHKPFLRLGYDRGAVDEFVTLVALAVRNERQTTVSADDVAQTRFPSRRLGRGYRMREVDDYLGAAEALLRTRATDGVGTRTATGGPHGHHHPHHPTWWIYGVAAVLVVAIVVFTLLQT